MGMFAYEHEACRNADRVCVCVCTLEHSRMHTHTGKAAESLRSTTEAKPLLLIFVAHIAQSAGSGTRVPAYTRDRRQQFFLCVCVGRHEARVDSICHFYIVHSRH